MVKNVVKTSNPIVPVATTEQPVTSQTLTVVVLDSKSQPVTGAHVSIQPSDASTVTNNLGEAQFNLGSATKYAVTATFESNTVTVPYYVTKNGATRLVVNPTYVKSVEARMQSSSAGSSNVLVGAGIIIGVVIVGIIIWKLLRKQSYNK